MARQRRRRDSRGCVEVGAGAVVEEDEAGGGGACRARLARRVSWMPGAEGAPGAPTAVDLVVEGAVGGTMRRDCGRKLVWVCGEGEK